MWNYWPPPQTWTGSYYSTFGSQSLFTEVYFLLCPSFSSGFQGSQVTQANIHTNTHTPLSQMKNDIKGYCPIFKSTKLRIYNKSQMTLEWPLPSPLAHTQAQSQMQETAFLQCPLHEPLGPLAQSGSSDSTRARIRSPGSCGTEWWLFTYFRWNSPFSASKLGAETKKDLTYHRKKLKINLLTEKR